MLTDNSIMVRFSFRDSIAVIAGKAGPICAISVEDGIVHGIDTQDTGRPGTDREFCNARVFPGFIDIHNHGAAGVDVNGADTDALLDAAEFLARQGVTAWVPTIVPDTDENYRRAIGAIDRLMEVQTGRPVAQAIGVHYEGVFANQAMCGALRSEYFRRFTGPETAALPRLKRGVHLTTLAPEVEGGIELIRELRRSGWIVAVGHTSADADTLDQAFEAGARHFTHFFNAMTGIHHREIGVAGWALANGDATFDIIADGHHVHPKMLNLACRAKSPEKVILISDSVAPAGMGDGEYELWGERVSVVEGRTRNARGSIAGSVITMLDAVNMMISLGFSHSEAAQMASANPAALLGMQADRGRLEKGCRADLVVLDESGKVECAMVGGEMVQLA